MHQDYTDHAVVLCNYDYNSLKIISKKCYKTKPLHDTKSRVHTILYAKYEKANAEKTATKYCHPLMVFE